MGWLCAKVVGGVTDFGVLAAGCVRQRTDRTDGDDHHGGDGRGRNGGDDRADYHTSDGKAHQNETDEENDGGGNDRADRSRYDYGTDDELCARGA